MSDLYRLSNGDKDEEAIELLQLLQRSGVLIPVTIDFEAAKEQVRIWLSMVNIDDEPLIHSLTIDAVLAAIGDSK